ncbi:uncharacterized protein LOC101953243 isoform X2 [Chrysemys picta bellii]|uniref:uncharacterized protein LOC101953243 isoform X2 n=1 Tax=Chrysemys picta bellii TaxID=8478 RepID=UPI0032B17BF6
MAGGSGTLTWLQKARNHIENSQEWRDFTARLCDAAQQQMTESHVHFFTDLSAAEKAFVLQRAAKAIQGGDPYNPLMSQVSTCLEEQLYIQVAHELQDGDRLKNKSALVLSHIKNGVMHLLEERPALKGKLQAFFNQPLPADLRRLTWRLYLSNTKARMEYLSQVAMNKAKSPKDREIFLRSQALLSTEPTFQHLKNNKVAARALRNILSYYHKLQDTAMNLPDTDYFLLVPLLQVVLDAAAPSLSLDSISAVLAEEFITFMNLRPQLMRLSSTKDPASASILEEATSMLEQKDRDLANIIRGIYSQTEDPQEPLRRALQHMLQPAISTVFVGYLTMDTLLYVWDQIIIGLDQPSYNCLPAFSTAFILLLRDYLKTCQSPGQMEAALRTQGPNLSVQEFQDVIRKHFFRELSSQLHGDDSDPFPVHDPTQALPPWSYLCRVPVPPRTRAQDRRQARAEREMLQRQHMERLKQEERLQRFREEEQKRQQEGRLLQLLEETKGTFEAQRVYLEEQLSQEKQLRYEIQRKAEAQINGLQAEIKRLMEKRLSIDAYSEGSLIAPAPSLQSLTPSQMLPPQPSPVQPPPPTVTDGTNRTREIHGKTAKTITLDLLEQLMQAANTIANGSNAAEQDSLNAATKEHLRNYNQDCKNAEIEVFGHQINTEDREKIPEPKRQLQEKLTAAIRRHAEARYKAQFAARRMLSEPDYMGAMLCTSGEHPAPPCSSL